MQTTELREISSSYIEKIYKDYAIYVCESRAIPKVSDGLKDALRKAHWILKDKNNEIKTLSLVGEMISSGLYLHGDAPASEAISMAASPFNNNVPLIEGIGNFGTKVTPKDFGAPRYTYVKRSFYAQKILYNDLDLVPLKENYDGSTKEPITFLPILPLVLLNGVSGIAVGWSTEILPRSLSQLIDVTIAVLNGNLNNVDLSPRFTYLDVDIKKISENSYEINGKIERKENDVLVIREIPPYSSIEKVKKNLDFLLDSDFIKDWNDYSSEEINIEIKFKKGDLNNFDDDFLLKKLKLSEKVTERIVVIDFDGKKIKQYNDPLSLVIDFVNWRLGFYKFRFEKLLREKEREIFYNFCLLQCFERNLIKNFIKFHNKKEIMNYMKEELQEFDPDDEILEKIVNLPTYFWSKEKKEEIDKKIEQMLNDINNYKHILSSDENLKKEYIKEVMEIRKIIKK
ncbi:MAG: hypothetical protein NZZ41_00125 [Candidatus Dojkabacteria bacterium]|nr:hypothetical protein [Candidatus Dojkabacteria bacterium]